MIKDVEKQSKEKAIIGCLLGTAIGDALGLSYEGLSKQRLIKLYPALNQYHFIFGKGMVSDDTEHTCLLAQSLIASLGDVEIFKKSFAWKLRFWLLGLPAGVGFATLRAILKLWLGFSPEKSGVFSAGNGPTMRSAIIGVCYGHDVENLYQLVKAATQITHTDPKAEFGALAVALAAYLSSLNKLVSPQEYLEKLQEWQMAKLRSRQVYREWQNAEELIALIKKTIESVWKGESTAVFAETLGLKNGVSGYVYHTVPVVIHAWLRNQDDYQSAILDIIRCGGDTDTTAAIVGGIVGARVGKQGIPKQWLDNLWEFPRHIKWMENLGRRLNQVCCFGFKQKALPISIIGVLLRNLIFMIIVLWHGFLRLLPPYS
jgi:ADP-ribosyl-[dinitrogen reductase] hydrolase